MSAQTASMSEKVTCSPSVLAEPISVPEAERLARVFRALGDPNRLRLLSAIASREGGEVCVCDLTEPFDLSQPTISHHLRVLREAGLVASERRGTWVYYSLKPGALDQVAALGSTS